MDAVIDLHVEDAATLEGNGVEFESRRLDEVGEVHVGLAHGVALTCPGLPCTGKLEEVSHESLHLACRIHRAIYPADVVGRQLRVFLDDAQICRDDRQRRLELVAGIGHKTALLLPCGFDGAQRPGGEEPSDREEHGE